MSHLVPVGEIHLHRSEAFEQRGVVRLEEFRSPDFLRVCTPLQEEVEEVSPALAQCEIEGGFGLEIRIVTVAQEKEDQAVAPCLQGDLEGGDAMPGRTPRPRRDLERAPLLNPALDLVDVAVTTKSVEILQLLRVRRHPVRTPWPRRWIQPRILERSHACTSHCRRRMKSAAPPAAAR
ncbi:MAG: hypothetical protein WD205_07555 [Rhodothermales bacterium]